jgi:hypothetical protein
MIYSSGRAWPVVGGSWWSKHSTAFFPLHTLMSQRAVFPDSGDGVVLKAAFQVDVL